MAGREQRIVSLKVTPSTDWSRRQLDTYAANLGIDTSRLLNKASVVEAIENAKP